MCRKKKIKCDGKMPSCTHCLNYKTECIFTQVEKKRQPPKGCVPLYTYLYIPAHADASQRKVH
jgi:hypothetical protein